MSTADAPGCYTSCFPHSVRNAAHGVPVAVALGRADFKRDTALPRRDDLPVEDSVVVMNGVPLNAIRRTRFSPITHHCEREYKAFLFLTCEVEKTATTEHGHLSVELNLIVKISRSQLFAVPSIAWKKVDAQDTYVCLEIISGVLSSCETKASISVDNQVVQFDVSA